MTRPLWVFSLFESENGARIFFKTNSVLLVVTALVIIYEEQLNEGRGPQPGEIWIKR